MALGTESVAQHGEDVAVWEYFGRKPAGVFVEVGANDPVALSMTWFLEQRGWRGLLVEPLPGCCERLRRERPGSIVCPVAAGAPGQPETVRLRIPDSDAWAYVEGVQSGRDAREGVDVPLRTLEALCETHGIEAIDFLSVDVEGMEEAVFRGLDFERRRPGLIVVEDHLDTLDLYFFLRRRGYRLVRRTGCNNWWVPRGAPGVAETPGERGRRWRDLWLKRGGRKLQRLWAGRRP